MNRSALAALLLAMSLVAGCTDPRQANYSCRPQINDRLPDINGRPPRTDTAGDKTCE